MGRKSNCTPEEIRAKKEAYFVKIAENRTNRALDSIHALEGLTADTYVYSDDQAAQIIAALHVAVDDLERVLLSHGESSKFRLSGDGRTAPATEDPTTAV